MSVLSRRRGLRARLEQAEAQRDEIAARWNLLVDEGLSAREMAVKVHDGHLDLTAVLGVPGPNVATRWLAGLFWAALLDGDGTEPPNYRETRLSLTVDGERIDAAMVVVKPGGRSPHELREAAQDDTRVLAAVLRHLAVTVDDDGTVRHEGADIGLHLGAVDTARIRPHLTCQETP